MTKDKQTQVRVLSERFLGAIEATDGNGLSVEDVAYGTMLAGFEQARNVALLTEELHAVRRVAAEQLAMAQAMLKRLEPLMAKMEG